MNYKDLGKRIVKLVGGESNIESLTHCATRLRFSIIDYNKVNVEGLNALAGVFGVVKSSVQLQVIIGNNVPDVYEAIYELTNQATSMNEGKDSNKKQNPIMRVIAVIPKVFTPILPVLVACGMLKALFAIAVMFKWIDNTTQTFIIFNYISDIVFYFLPFFVAVSSAKEFKANTYMSLALAGILLHPTFVGLVNAREAVHLFGLPVQLMNYASSLVPIIMGVYCLSKLESLLKKVIPDFLQFIFLPMFELLIMAILMLVIIGPAGSYLSKYVTDIFFGMYEVVGIPAIILMAAFKPLIVATGMHYGFTAAFMTTFSATGMDKFYVPASILANIAQGGAAFGVGLRAKSAELKSVAFSTSFSAIMGITEPAMFGITLKYKKPMIAAMIGAAAGGLYIGIMGVKIIAMTGVSILGVLGSAPESMMHFSIGSAITIIVSAIVAFVLGFNEEDEKGEKKNIINEKNTQIITSPIAGKVVSLSSVTDEAFATEIIGKGVAIIPSKGKMFSPVNGVITAIFYTNHAVGITSDKGEEILVHIGINTVQLEGKYFTPKVKQGDKVKKGQLLLSFDLEAIIKEGFDITTPIVITNKDQYMDILAVNKLQTVEVEDDLLAIID